MNRFARMTIVFLVPLIAICLPLSSTAEIYKYQDKSGRWHFTDKPPGGTGKTEVLSEEKDQDSSTPSDSIAERLYEKYKPESAIEKASVAVVKIESPLSNGSGFFISDNGYILTNKHVVKPTETKAWQDLEERVKETKQSYDEADEILRNERIRLKNKEKTLQAYKKEIDEANDGYAKRLAMSEYTLYQDQYRTNKKKYLEVKRKYNVKKRAYEKARREFNIETSSAYLRKNFLITLKDELKLSARLVDVSDKHDLALLKIKHYQTPYIQPAKMESVRQGMEIFAIGSPLGLRDVMTTGIVSGIRENYIITDSKILPGSSGGPLVNAEGKAVGINSLRISKTIGGEGFGVAISMDVAMEEFGKFLNNSQ